VRTEDFDFDGESDDDEEKQIFDHDDDGRPIDFMVQPSDLPTFTKLLGREMLDDAKGDGCHQDKCLLIRKTFNGAERYLFQILLFFKNSCRRNMQFQHKSHKYFKFFFTAELFEDYYKMTNV
jgi:hypothetical protein